MRIREIGTEAVRSVATRTSAPILLLVLLASVVSGLALADVSAVSRILADSRAFVASGASVTTVDAAGAIDGAMCEAVSTSDRVRASGALAPMTPMTFSVLPSSEVPTMRVTTGLLEVLATDTAAGVTGVVVSQAVATALGLAPGDDVDTTDGPVAVLGVFQYPDDGRRSGFAWSVLVPVPAAGGAAFDECWADRSRSDADPSALLLSTVTRESPAVTASLGQLNNTLGTTSDPIAAMRARPTAGAAAVAGLVGLALGIGSKRARRREFASALHARVPRPALAAQILLEDLLVLVPGVGIVAAASFVVAGAELPADVATVLGVGAGIAASGAAGVIVGSQTALALTRERHLFRYVKGS